MAHSKMCGMKFLGSWEIITPWVIIFMVTSSKKGKQAVSMRENLGVFVGDVFKRSAIC